MSTLRRSTEAEDAERRAEKGASLVEYVFLLSLIVVVCLVSINFLGGQLVANFDSSGSAIQP